MTKLNATRRGALLGATAALATPAAHARAAADPRLSALGQIKMEACLDGHPAVWSYSGSIYAVRPGERPRAILGIAGGTATWATRQADGAWLMSGATVSFFRDPVSGAFIDTFDNPWTSHAQNVRPNILSGGAMLFPADGGSARFLGQSRAGETTPGGFKPADPTRSLGMVRWEESPRTVMLFTDHAFEVPVQPQLEARTIFAERRDFVDPRIRRMPARMTTTTIVPWLRWMEMGDAAGHLVWHCSGEKLFAVADLPADYRGRAGKLLDTLAIPPQG